MERRVILKTGLGTVVATTMGAWARPGGSAAAPDEVKWRAFEVVTRAEVANPTGATRVWLPLPLQTDTDYFKSLGQSWTVTPPSPACTATSGTARACSTRSGRPARARPRSR